MKSNKLKLLYKYTGYVLTIISFYMISLIVIDNIHQLNRFVFSYETMLLLLFGSLAILIGHYNLVLTWFFQLKNKYKKLTIIHTFVIIGVSQIAKYLPGNVAHILGRGILSKEIIEKPDIIYSLFMETFLLSLSALFLGFIYFYLYRISFNIDFIHILTIFLSFAILFFLIIKFIKKKVSLISINNKTISTILIINIFSFFVHGTLIYSIANSYSDIPSLSLTQFTTGFALAFLAGYLLPGAPGGLGIREYAFVVLFTHSLGENIALEIIVIYRLISIIGDVLFFLLAYRLKQKKNFSDQFCS